MAENDTGLHVELVQADRLVWSGRATMVVARSVTGDLGVLPGHAPLLTLLLDGVVTIHPVEGHTVRSAVLGGFLSVHDNRVSILAEDARLSDEIDLADAHRRLEELRSRADVEEAQDDLRRAEAIVRAVEGAEHSGSATSAN
jgi:F-type H+-transporting ATPase subunit epsilon